MNDGERNIFLRRFFSFNAQETLSNNVSKSSNASPTELEEQEVNELNELNKANNKSNSNDVLLNNNNKNNTNNETETLLNKLDKHMNFKHENANELLVPLNFSVGNKNNTINCKEDLIQRRCSNMKCVREENESGESLDCDSSNNKSPLLNNRMPNSRTNFIQNQLQQQQSIELLPFSKSQTNNFDVITELNQVNQDKKTNKTDLSESHQQNISIKYRSVFTILFFLNSPNLVKIQFVLKFYFI